MITLILTATLSLPIPPIVPTLGTSTQHTVVADTATMTRLPATGKATYYGAGIFPGVVERQIKWGNIEPDTCPDCDGYAAMLWPADLDRVVCVEANGRVFRLWVVDSAAGHHRQALIDDGWVIDLQRAVWLEMGFWNAPTMVTVEDC